MSLVSTCQVQRIDSSDAAWGHLQLHDCACGLKEKSRLMREFSLLKMETRKNPKKCFLTVDRVAKQLERPRKTVNQDYRNLTIVSALSSAYEEKRRMPTAGVEGLSRACTQRVVNNQYERFQGRKRMLAQKCWQQQQCAWLRNANGTTSRDTLRPSAIACRLRRGSSARNSTETAPTATCGDIVRRSAGNRRRMKVNRTTLLEGHAGAV